MKRLSISQRLKCRNWYDDQMGLITDLEYAIRNDNYDLLCRVAGQLKAVTEKRFNGLSNVLISLINENCQKNDTE